MSQRIRDFYQTSKDVCIGVLSCFSHVQLFATPWTVARQAPLSMGFSRQEYWSGLPCPPPGDLPDPGDKTCVSCIAGSFFTASVNKSIHQLALFLRSCQKVLFISVFCYIGLLSGSSALFEIGYPG